MNSDKQKVFNYVSMRLLIYSKLPFMLWFLLIMAVYCAKRALHQFYVVNVGPNVLPRHIGMFFEAHYKECFVSLISHFVAGKMVIKPRTKKKKDFYIQVKEKPNILLEMGNRERVRF